MAHRGVRHAAVRADEAGRPRSIRAPAASRTRSVQLRQDNLAGDHYSLVGFQTQLKWGEQARVLRLIPGLEQAEFVRFGMVHRNTYVNGPTVLAETWQVRPRPTLFFAGQMSGVEGYVESAASGLLAGLNAAALASGEPRLGAAADDRDRRAGVLRLARQPGALRAVEHHLRHHGAARRAAARASAARKLAIAERALGRSARPGSRRGRTWRAPRA